MPVSIDVRAVKRKGISKRAPLREVYRSIHYAKWKSVGTVRLEARTKLEKAIEETAAFAKQSFPDLQIDLLPDADQ
jgi:hypothetical protein